MGKGEAEVIGFAYKNKGFKAVLDDKAARNCSVSLQIDVIGTIGIILMAKRHGIIANSVVYLEKLKETGYRISDELYQQAIQLAGKE